MRNTISSNVKIIVSLIAIVCLTLPVVELIDLPAAEARSAREKRQRNYRSSSGYKSSSKKARYAASGRKKSNRSYSGNKSRARKQSSSARNKSGQSRGGGRYPASAHNSDFLNSCTDKSVPTVYNPNINNSMEGGKRNRHGENVIAIEDAAKTGQPVTVAMDIRGEFGKQCNWKNNNGTQRKSCLLLVHLPGLDKTYPAYKNKFPNLPQDSFIAIVEDTGGAFYNKGTGKMDIPFKDKKLYKASPFKQLNFEVLEQLDTAKAKTHRGRDMSHVKPFVSGRTPKCGWGPDREVRSSVAGMVPPAPRRAAR